MVVKPRRLFCLTCENEGRRTRLVETDRGGCCPIHEKDFIASLTYNSRLRLGINPNGPTVPNGRPTHTERDAW